MTLRNSPARLLLGLLLGLGQTLSAQAADAWFGVPLPTGMGDRHAPAVDVSHADPAPASVPAGEIRTPELRGEAIFPLLEQIVGFSRESLAEGNRVWGRVTGFPSALRTQQWVAEQFRAAGLEDVALQEYPADGPFWWPRDWEVRLMGNNRFGAGSRDVVLESSLVTAGSEIPGGSLIASPVFTGSIHDPLPMTDLRGKVAIQQLTPETGAFSDRTPTRERAQALMARGAVAVINIVEQIGNMHTRDFSNCNGPCYNVGTDDGRFLRGVMARAIEQGVADQLQLRLSLQASELTGLTGHNAIGVIPGNSRENIILNAHADGWYDAAGDNGDGLAVLVALARHFSRPENRQERTLVFVASGGHHSPGMNGPGHLVPMNPERVANTVLVINLEHIAQLEITSGDWQVGPREQPMNFGVSNSSPFLVDLARTGAERYGFNINPTITDGVPGDLGGYRSLGVALVQAIHSGPLYHASGDVLETISVPGLERAARFYAYFASEAAKADKRMINPR